MESKVPPQAEDNVGQDQPNTIVIQLVTIPYNSNRQATPYSVQAIPLYFGPTDPQAGPAQRGVPDRTRTPGAPDMAAPPKQMSPQSPNRSPRNCCTQCRGQNYSQAPLPSFIPARTYPMAPGPRPGVRRYPTDDEARLPRRCFCQCSCQRNTVPQQEVFEEQPETLNNSQREQAPVAEPGDEGYRDQGTNTTEAGAAGAELPNLAALKVICESLGKAMVAAAAVAVEAAQKKTMGIDTEKSEDKSNDQSNLSSPKLKASFHNRLIHDYIPSDPGDAESIDADGEQSPENEPEDMRAVDDEKLINVENQNNTDSIDENKDPNKVLEKIKSEDEAVGEETNSIRYLDEPVVNESKIDEEVLSMVSREYPKTPRPTYLFPNTDDIDSGNNSPTSSPIQNENQATNEVPEVSPSKPEQNNLPKAVSEAAKIVYPLSISRIIEDTHQEGSPRNLHLAADSHSDHAKTKLYPIQRSHDSSMEHFVDPSESERSVQVERIAPLKLLKTNNDSTVSLFNKTNSKVDDSGQESSQDEENEEKSRIASGSSTIHDKKRNIDVSRPYSEDLPGNSSSNKVSSGKSPSVHSSLKKSFSKKAPKKSVSFANCCVDKPSSTGKQKCRHISSKAKRKGATNAAPIYRSSGPASWVNSPVGFPTSQISCHTFQYTKANSSQRPTPEDQTYSVQHKFKSVDPNM